jgi:hypothetical protein
LTHNPSYITQNRFGIFYFQYRVPNRFRNDSKSSQKLVRFSLRTRVRREALESARRCWTIADDAFATHDELHAAETNLRERLRETFRDAVPSAFSHRVGKKTNSIDSGTEIESTPVPLLSELVESYAVDTSLGWDKKHFSGNERDLRPRLDLIVEVIGDKPCNKVTREDVSRFKEVVMRLPSNRLKKPGLGSG